MNYTILERLFHENLSARLPTPFNRNEGILTYSTRETFVGFQLLYASILCKHTCVNLVLVDCGLSSEQRNWCSENDIFRVIPDSKFFLLEKEVEWVKWNKPKFFSFSPFIKTILMEPCLMLTGSLHNLFSTLQSEPVLPPINSTYPADDDMLYARRLPIRLTSLPVMRVYPRTKFVGLNIERDYYLLRDWLWATVNAADSQNIRMEISEYDRGTLGWALVKNEMLNQCHLTRPYTMEGLENPYASPDDLIERIDEDCRGADIVQFRVKPWKKWNQDCLNFSLKNITIH